AADSGWGNGVTVGTLALSVALLAGFFLWETRAAHPMMPVRVIRDRNRGGAYLVMLTVGASLFGIFSFVTYFVQQVRHFSTLKPGFAFLPIALTIGVVSQLMTTL